ncbi:MAG: hypothetical protein KAJ91_03405 [Candidatus Aenigmarchaeota archaeon]|nr:hypothetical protein [Candidatus Aenigmarchaeota archaeon]
MANYMNVGKKQCPRCGRVGTERKEQGINFFECPLCHTEYTPELILSVGDSEFEFENN